MLPLKVITLSLRPSSLSAGLPPPLQGLGYGILAGSTLVKVPQVLNVVRARSAAGLSPLAFELETLGLVIAVTYGFLMGLPISAFGETVVGAPGSSLPTGRRPRAGKLQLNWGPACRLLPTPALPPLCVQALLFQNCGLLVLIYFYQRRSLARTITLLSVLAGSGFVALSGTLSQAAITTLYDCNNFILVASRWVRMAVCSGLSRNLAQPFRLAQTLKWLCYTRAYFACDKTHTGVTCRRVPQIWQNFIAGSTGQLSLVTYALNTAGAAARIFTSVQENAGAAMLRGAVISEWQQAAYGSSSAARRDAPVPPFPMMQLPGCFHPLMAPALVAAHGPLQAPCSTAHWLCKLSSMPQRRRRTARKRRHESLCDSQHL